MSNKPSVLDALGPKKSFGLGLVMAPLLLFSIGFFILLANGDSGNIFASSDSKANSPQVKTQAQAPTPTPQDSSVTGEIQLVAVSEVDWVKGNRNAKISIVEFSDTECPFCKQFHPTMQKVIEEYGDQVNWVYRHFPLDSLHPKAPKEAEATECAGELGGNEKFWAYLDRIFEITPANNGLEASQLPAIAEYIGLDKSKFEECLNSGKYANKVQSQYQQAVAAGGRGTPYSVIVVGDQKIPLSGALPYEQIKSTLDAIIQ